MLLLLKLLLKKFHSLLCFTLFCYTRNLESILIDFFRSQKNFKIGGPEELMPLAVIHAFGYLKKAAAICNQKFGLERKLCDAIVSAAGISENFF